MESKRCQDCGVTKPLSDFGVYKRPHRAKDTEHKMCKLCYNARMVKYMSSEEQRLKKYYLKIEKKYGITRQDYEDMLAEQNGVCAICGKINRFDAFHQRLAVDHNHDTGNVRGILCTSCNSALGMVDDNIEVLEKMISYLKERR